MDNGQGNQDGSSGRPRVPEWLAKLGIQEGEWTHESKLCLKRAMKCRAMGEAGRVYACLAIHTKAFRQELAVKMVHGKKEPLTPQDVAEQTGIHRKNVPRALTELKHWGLVDMQGSTKGRILIYAWVQPRPVDVEKIVIARDDNFKALQEDLKPLESYYRLWKIPVSRVSLARDEVEALMELAREYEKAKMALARGLKGHLARAAYKEEIKGSEIEVKVQSSSSAVASLQSPSEPAPQTSPRKADEEDYSFEKLKKNYPKARMDTGKAMKAYYCLKVSERRAAVQALPKFVESARWQDKEGQFVPFASKWLTERQWESEPPPAFKPTVRANGIGLTAMTGLTSEEADELLRKEREKDEARLAALRREKRE